MRQSVAVLCFFSFLSMPVHAQNRAAAARDQHQREEQMMRRGAASGGVRTNVIEGSTTEDWIVVPAAGSLQGGLGTFYKSDVTISNYRNVPQIVRARWIPINGDGFSTTEKYLTIPANSFITYDDFVGQTLNYTGLGSVEFVSRTASDQLDLDAEIDIFSRIWTPQPNTTLGTVSQNFDGVGFFHTMGSDPVQAIGLKQNASFRTNVGIVNLDLFDPRTFVVTVTGTGGQTSFPITVPAYSMVQQSLPAGAWGNMRITFTPPSTMTSRWVAYASSSDNGTGDGWVAVASRVRD